MIGSPSLGHDQTEHDLATVLTVIAGVPEGGHLTHPVALEVAGGEVIEDQVQGQAEELGHPRKDLLFDLLAMGMQGVHGPQVVVVVELGVA